MAWELVLKGTPHNTERPIREAIALSEEPELGPYIQFFTILAVVHTPEQPG